MELSELFISLGIALGLGLLVGFQREKTKRELAGLRTFPLITIWGGLAGYLSIGLGGWVLAASIVALATLIVVGNLHLIEQKTFDAGLTTEVAMLVMFLVGAWLVLGPREVAVAIGGGVAVLLQAKDALHGLTERLDRDDLTAIMRFALIALVILPILPDEPFGPYDVLNLRAIWLLVVLIVGISLGGYIVYRFFGSKAGVLLGGLLGGVISSTATTVSYARRSRQHPEGARLAAVVVLIANSVVMIRVLVEIWLVGRSLFPAAAGPIGLLLLVQTAISLLFWWRVRHQDADLPEQENPAELKPALLFAALYAVVLVGVAAARTWFGDRGMYVVALISGLTDVDAITLSTAKLAETGGLETPIAWRLIVVATLSNLAFKTAVVATIGSRRMLGIIAFGALITAATGIAILLLWPG
ncbi:MAG: MgtC/SapB family protein [Thermoanaerobaculia bacterium]